MQAVLVPLASVEWTYPGLSDSNVLEDAFDLFQSHLLVKLLETD